MSCRVLRLVSGTWNQYISMYFEQQLAFTCLSDAYTNYEQNIRYIMATVNKIKVIKDKTGSSMLGTVHQHLFHALVCSDFILPDIHCTVH